MGSKFYGPSGPRSRFFIVGQSFSAWYWPLYMASMQNWHFWRSEESSISCHFLTICGPLTTYTQIFDHSFHCINATGINQNGHKSRCSELISGTKALQFVTFWKFLSLTENTGELWSKDIDHIYGVQIWWSEWSQITIFHSWRVILSVVLALIHG